MNPLAVATVLYAAVIAVVLGVLAMRVRTMGRLRVAGIVVAIAAGTAMFEDAGLASWYALATPALDPDAVRGVVHEHARGHMLGAGAWAFVAGALCIWIALGPLRRGERWAWRALLAALVVGGGTDLYELLAIYPHGLNGVGFGWPPLVLYLAAWTGGLAMAAPTRAQTETPAV